jgi:hypothetical protein
MCEKVVIYESNIQFALDQGIEFWNAQELETFGIPLIDIDDDWKDDCFCGSDPEPSLLAAGYTVKHDAIWGDIYAIKNSEPNKETQIEEECSYTL